MHIGVDIIEIRRISKLIGHEKFLTTVFTKKELSIVNQFGEARRVQSLAGRFAAKEATVKALGIGFDLGIVPADIEVLNNEDGKPILILHNHALKAAQELGINEANVSISHDRISAIAFVVLNHIS